MSVRECRVCRSYEYSLPWRFLQLVEAGRRRSFPSAPNHLHTYITHSRLILRYRPPVSLVHCSVLLTAVGFKFWCFDGLIDKGNQWCA